MKPLVRGDTAPPSNAIGHGAPWWLAALLVAILLLSVNLDQFLTRRSISTVVLQANLPTHCTSSEPLFPWPRRRSSIPVPGQPFCGVVITEHGTFRVVEDGMLILGGMDRHKIVEGLRPTCLATVHYFGWGGPPRLWPGYNPQTKLWIYSIEYEEECVIEPFVRN
jgi:hypothetical protein